MKSTGEVWGGKRKIKNMESVLGEREINKQERKLSD